MKKYFYFTILLCGFTLQLMASVPPGSEVWERNAALAVINTSDIDVAVAEIGGISSLGDARGSLDKLAELETRSDWPLPVREAALYRFTRSLARLPRDAVAGEVMQYLRRYQARTLVPHEEQPDAYVPLFNIRSAASGVENGWSRMEATAKAVQLFESNPAALIDSYLQTSSNPQRSGYLDAVQLAQLNDVIAVQDNALQRLADEPTLTSLVAATSTITNDHQAMQAVLIKGHGAGLTQAFIQFGQRLDDEELANLLNLAVQQAPATNASLAIAAWWPRLRHDAPTRDLLISLLDDSELGSSAVLALSQSPNVQTIKLLQDTAMSDAKAAVRAQQALDLNRAQLTGELQP